ncbi:hypothetical protein G6722_02155 [Polynucleobacter paneuropaeus]|jgi:hypothetical protein|nr:hypothetical protein [Polynucleobacter paneuropaeus]
MSSLPKMPAYQEYPADILNNEVFMQLSMAQRGLLWTLRMYCWKNETIPAGYQDVARLIGITDKESKKLFDELVRSFFDYVLDERSKEPIARLFNKDLEEYRKEKIAARERRSKSGMMGAEAKWNKIVDDNAKTTVMAKEMSSNDTEHDSEYVAKSYDYAGRLN